MFSHRSFLPLLVVALPYVSAHGFVKRVDVVRPDGTLRSSTVGPVPNNGGAPSVVRAINSVAPIVDLNSPAMNCGPGAQPAALVADVEAGDVLKFAWASGDGPQTEWPHNTGPVLDYIASCGAAGCADFDALQADWFKVQEQGRRPDGQWVQANIFNQPDTLDMVVPDFLPDGEYLVRHEIIGLHVLGNTGNTEHYPSCIGIRILPSGGNAAVASLPDLSQSTRFPGGYSRQDRGLNRDTTNAFDSNTPYAFPGPAPITAGTGGIVDDNDSSSTVVPTSPPVGSATDDVPSQTSDVAAPSASVTLVPCGIAQAKLSQRDISKRSLFRRESLERFKAWVSRRAENAVVEERDEGRPRVLSRVMRNLD